jgi:hypothetical protein
MKGILLFFILHEEEVSVMFCITRTPVKVPIRFNFAGMKKLPGDGERPFLPCLLRELNRSNITFLV